MADVRFELTNGLTLQLLDRCKSFGRLNKRRRRKEFRQSDASWTRTSTIRHHARRP